MSREGTGAPSDPIDIVVKEENVEVDKGEDLDEILIRPRLEVKGCIHQWDIVSKCFQRHINASWNITKSPSFVPGLLMPFTGEESKSLEFFVDCYNQSKNFNLNLEYVKWATKVLTVF